MNATLRTGFESYNANEGRNGLGDSGRQDWAVMSVRGRLWVVITPQEGKPKRVLDLGIFISLTDKGQTPPKFETLSSFRKRTKVETMTRRFLDKLHRAFIGRRSRAHMPREIVAFASLDSSVLPRNLTIMHCLHPSKE